MYIVMKLTQRTVPKVAQHVSTGTIPGGSNIVLQSNGDMTWHTCTVMYMYMYTRQ